MGRITDLEVRWRAAGRLTRCFGAARISHRIGLAAGLMVLGLVVTACAEPSATSQADDGAASPSPVISPTRGDISSTLVLPARVVARAGIVITAPFPGTFSIEAGMVRYVTPAGDRGTLQLPEGVMLTRWPSRIPVELPLHHPIAEAEVQQFAVVADLDPAAVYRMYGPPGRVRAQIDQGPGPFDCPLADPVPSSVADESPGQPHTLSLVCVIPLDEPVFEGMTAVMAVETGSANNVLLLPVEAIAGSAEHGEVTVVRSNGDLEPRTIELGITDGAQIEVVSGLSEDDKVILPGPDLIQGSQ